MIQSEFTFVNGLIPAVRQGAAAKKLSAFIQGKPEYASLNT